MMNKSPKNRRTKVASGKTGDKKIEPLQIKRHYQRLSPKETDELVDAFAEMIVERIKAKGVPVVKKEAAGSQAHEPDEPANEPG